MTMRFLATINIPGYLPMDDDPPVFDTAAEAWGYLAEQRECSIEDAEMSEGEYLEDVWHYLTAQAEEPSGDGTGVAYGSTPGYAGNHDLGLAYSVSIIEGV